MNVYEKLLKSRVDLQKKNCKKSGMNSFSKYSYYNLSDFLPELNEILLANKLATVVSFSVNEAVLMVIDAEKPEETITFACPSMTTANVKGASEIQNLGAVQTYVRRYLYTIAFEIAESDICDQQPPQENKPTRQKQKKEPMATEKQLADMVKLAKEKNLVAKMPDLLKQIAGVSSSKELTLDMADKVICTLAEMNAA